MDVRRPNASGDKLRPLLGLAASRRHQVRASFSDVASLFPSLSRYPCAIARALLLVPAPLCQPSLPTQRACCSGALHHQVGSGGVE